MINSKLNVLLIINETAKLLPEYNVSTLIS